MINLYIALSLFCQNTTFKNGLADVCQSYAISCARDSKAFTLEKGYLECVSGWFKNEERLREALKEGKSK